MFTNCFAYRKYMNGQEECSILTENICQNRNCSFYRSQTRKPTILIVG